MARRGMAGQLNMFDFFHSLDAGAPGEVEMVSLVPSYEEEPEEVEVPELVEEPIIEDVPEPVEETETEYTTPVARENENVAMCRTYEIDGKKIEIAYINYNKVRITKGNEAPVVKEFLSTKEAVDYYVEQMQEFEADE